MAELHGEYGDLEAGLGEATHLVTGTWQTQRVAHTHLETHGTIGWLEHAGTPSSGSCCERAPRCRFSCSARSATSSTSTRPRSASSRPRGQRIPPRTRHPRGRTGRGSTSQPGENGRADPASDAGGAPAHHDGRPTPPL
ncbi:molybdopterin cofactor-binding domain-containing protein [Cryobacterium breve]|uniref:molybdopterin cofactor-binding domain-containing protein n=1 Tax=Cryobacterium breve TaxID=1259258 RepID=UPI00248AD9D0|nr:molybdopterin-dependent oxidoreductase [Cryobacterium breve]